MTRSRIRRRALALLPATLAITVLAGCTLQTAGSGGAAPDGGTGALSVADGHIPTGEPISPFADVPAIQKLDPALRSAVQQAATDAAAAGIQLRISSGWRSARLQDALLAQAKQRYGSATEAGKFVRDPQTSSHVTGHAVDVLPTAADDWLIRHGNAYGLCQSYANEMWHFELSTHPGGTCPPPAADAEVGP